MPEGLYFVEAEDAAREVVMNGYLDGKLNEFDFVAVSKLVEEYLGLEPIRA